MDTLLNPLLVARQLLLFAHLLAFAWAIVTVLRADLRLLASSEIDPGELRAAARAVGFALALLWLSGGVLILMDVGTDVSAILANPKLAAKLTVVALLTLNGVVLHRVAFPALVEPRGHSRIAPAAVAVLGAVSTVSWLYAAFVGCARFIAPAMSYRAFIGLYAAVLAAGALVALAGVRPRVARMMDEAAALPGGSAGRGVG